MSADELIAHYHQAREMLLCEMEAHERLRAAAQAVVDQWDAGGTIALEVRFNQLRALLESTRTSRCGIAPGRHPGW
jgi:hypothetical protein